MSIIELPYRLLQFGQKLIELVFCKSTYVNNFIYQGSIKIIEPVELDFNDSQININVFSKSFPLEMFDFNWHKDIFSGREFEKKFAKSINIRQFDDLSAKNVWEINRLQFIPQLAIQYNKSGDIALLHKIVDLNISWIDNNPYLIGVNWYSNIEVNLRLINWFFTWEILDVEMLCNKHEWFKDFTEKIWLPVIYKHCYYSKANPSKYSSANNHLISEYAGLFIAASKWKFSESAQWLNYAKKGLETEIVKQHVNGINKEEAAEYIQFITDFLLITYVVGKKTNNSFSEKYEKTLNEIAEYIYLFTDIKTNFPRYGDEDDGRVVKLYLTQNDNNFKSILSSAAILFASEKYKTKSNGYDLKNQILFGKEGQKNYDSLAISDNLQSSFFFEKEGHLIFRKQKAIFKEIYLHFDAAPLGYLAIAAHGHADALSFVMNINGREFFIDSGTYSYHIAKKWREYFVGTTAHNTICIDDLNQAYHASDTMWLNHYKCDTLSVIANDDYECVEASHTGYKNVQHRRKIEFNKVEESFTITDYLTVTDNKEHSILLHFHLHPEIEILETSKSNYKLSDKQKIKLRIECDNQLVTKIIKGSEDPVLGWYSPSFMQKCPTNVIQGKQKINSNTTLITKIYIDEY